jgi:hypothetical protein
MKNTIKTIVAATAFLSTSVMATDVDYSKFVENHIIPTYMSLYDNTAYDTRLEENGYWGPDVDKLAMEAEIDTYNEMNGYWQ